MEELAVKLSDAPYCPSYKNGYKNGYHVLLLGHSRFDIDLQCFDFSNKM